jgi:predicted RNA-binding Zn ribbon-like protein
MKKALHDQKEVFLSKQRGKIDFWDFDIEEILIAVNDDLEDNPKDRLPWNQVLPDIHDWVSRYFREGVTDAFLDDLNSAMKDVRHTKCVLPHDLLASDTGYPRSGYITDLDEMPSPEAYAANDFSRILTSGMLERVRRCQMEGCKRLFAGPPQAKWCSKTCGSKHRVRKKRKRDSF